MDWTLVVAVLAFVISLAALCAWAVFLFQRTRDPDVEELAAQVVSLRKSHRAEQMRRVRETPPQAPGAPGEDAPPGFGQGDPMARVTKEQLRRIAVGIDVLRKH